MLMIIDTPGDGNTPSERADRSIVEWVEELFGAYVNGVFNVAYRVVWNHSDAEDIVQATFVKAFARIGQLKDPSKARSWLFQVAYREAISVVRQRRSVPVDPNDLTVTPSTGVSPADHSVSVAVVAEISAAMQRLNSDERIAVVLRDVEDMPMKHVAEVLGIGLSAAKMRVHRGRQNLRVMLTDAEIR